MAVRRTNPADPFIGKDRPCLPYAMSLSLLWERTKPGSTVTSPSRSTRRMLRIGLPRFCASGVWEERPYTGKILFRATAARVHACVIDNRIPGSMSEDHTKGEL